MVFWFVKKGEDMGITYGYCTDIGIKKKENQDSLCIKNAVVDGKPVTMAIICDGMGGLSKGELASASVINAFTKWFEQDMATTSLKVETIKAQWEALIQRANEKLFAYGVQNGLQLGTTLTLLLLIEEKEYLIAHVGDSRAYVAREQMLQLTEDQSFVAREIKRGKMTPEQAELDPRRNVLLQCIGASKVVVPEYYEGQALKGDGYLLCSDGFRHKLTEAEMYDGVRRIRTQCNRVGIDSVLRGLVNENMQRGETDNITVLYVQIS